MEAILSYFLRLQRPWMENSNEEDLEQGTIEDYNDGYPQFTALIAAHRPWFICRRFDQLRARLLLLKQDKLTMLERQLQEIDKSEDSLLFLGRSRVDGNKTRLSTLSEIEAALEDYDQFLERTASTFNLQQADQKDIASLQNWVASTGSLAREETEYLLHKHELISLAPATDSAVKQLEAWVEAKLTKYWHGFRTNRSNNRSKRENVYIFKGRLIQRTAKALLFSIIAILLLMPVIACNLVSNTSVRIVVVIVFTIVYLLILSCLTKSRTMELILAGATPTDNFVLTNDEDRPGVDPAAAKPLYRVGDKVNILNSSGTMDPDGPYLVSSVALPDKCTLCSPQTYKKAKDGAVIEMAVLVKV
ncbi:hypothetical protein F66182_6054 [Fusarium sp. NRRL 66182]|nr:hypothetical protein F66182_6054 [Fusarium sp. NRRL 66182]